MQDAATILKTYAQWMEEYLRQVLDDCAGSPPQLIEAIRYSLLAGGKRLRPSLVFESFRAIRPEAKPPPDLSFPMSAKAAAVAVELVHTFSLVHDDLPAMDDDDLRRGKPTCHKVFGQAMAILAGDAMAIMAFEHLARQSEADLAPRLIAELAAATGPAGMIGGQVLDIAGDFQNLSAEQLQQTHRMKTASLIAACCRMGAISARANDREFAALSDFGLHLGLAFQIVDDILDVTCTPQQLGKATGKDASRGKCTWPTLMGLQASRQEADRQLRLALDSLASFGPAADGLRVLARFVVERQL